MMTYEWFLVTIILPLIGVLTSIIGAIAIIYIRKLIKSMDGLIDSNYKLGIGFMKHSGELRGIKDNCLGKHSIVDKTLMDHESRIRINEKDISKIQATTK